MRSAFLGVILGILSTTAPAFADGNSTPPDVIYKKDGTIMRGTIIERIPNKQVEILLPNGQSRKIDMKEVEFAGPVTETPAAKAAAEEKSEAKADAKEKEEAAKADDDADRVPVRLTSKTPKTTVLVEAASASYLSASGVLHGFSAYAPVCDLPCDRAVKPGTYKLALSRGEGELLQAPNPVVVADKPIEVEGRIVSRKGTRIAGWGVTLGSIGLGTYLTVDSFGKKQECSTPGDPTSCYETTDLNLTELLIGTIGGTVGMMVGIALAYTPDKADFVVRPMTMPSSSRASASADPMNRALPNGLGMSGRF